MIYINECEDCGKCWHDDGITAYRVGPWERTCNEWSIEPVVCDDCLRVSSRARTDARAVSLSSTPKVKAQPEDGKNEQGPQYDAVDNKQMVSDQKIGGVWWRCVHHTARVAGWLIAKFWERRESQKDNQND